MICTKWPRLLVVGEPVTRDQASEILIRTNSWWWLGSNDKAWERAVSSLAAEFGYPVEPERTFGPGYDHDAWLVTAAERWKRLDAWLDEWRMLGGEYLHNDQIMSSWIGGPHGWCDWDGNIGCSNYNIGKWPTDDEVTEEWTTIAEAFPFLTLTAQCIDDEGEGRLAAEWRVHQGTVRYVAEPTEVITPPVDGPWTVFDPFGERGAALGRIREAFEVTRAAREASHA